jgi:hypothetical protein
VYFPYANPSTTPRQPATNGKLLTDLQGNPLNGGQAFSVWVT